MSMQKLEYRVRFVTPAFLGNAEQNGQWRTPPFKALLRQWWRIVKAPQVAYNHIDLKKEEAELFGSASDTGGSGSGRSRVVVRLDSWELGTMRLNYEQGRTIARGTAIAPFPLGEQEQKQVVKQARLALLVPESDCVELQRTIELIAHFGTLGSRSRNGWGSLDLQPEKDTPTLASLTRENLQQWKVCRPLADCLKLDWPHAIGTDEKGPLVWRLNPQSKWQAAITELAEIKINFRTQFPFQGNTVGKRHVLAYPVTNHQVWGPKKRMANQLRFKISCRQDNQIEALIYHLPCKVPDALLTDPQQKSFIRGIERDVWQAVHATLDNNARRLE